MPVERHRKKWRARVVKNGERINIGTYPTEQEARFALEAWKREARADRLRSLDWGPGASQSEKRREYEVGMAEAEDYISSLALDASAGKSLDERAARYITGLAESEERFAYNRRPARHIAITLARDALMVRHLKEALADVFKKLPEPRGYAVKTPDREQNRTIVGSISDLHIGARLKSEELPRRYSAVEEARRLAKVTCEIRDMKPQYRDQSRLVLLVLGDLIAGLLHEPHTGDALTDQFAGAVYPLAQMVQTLAAAYPSMHVVLRGGNHGRNRITHPGRQTSQKWDNYEMMIGLAVQAATANCRNVTWDLGLKPYGVVDLFGYKLLATHGDTVFSLGSPGRVLQINRINSKMATINSTKKYNHVFSVFVVGHVHVAMHTVLSAGDLIINPPLTPTDGYADAHDMFSICGAMLWEAVEGYPVGDMRIIRVGDAEDSDSTLDRIITPARFSYDPYLQSQQN